MDKYKILGVDSNSTLEDIKKAYHALAHKHHPDKGGDVKKFIEIKDAYEWINKNHKIQIQERKEIRRVVTIFYDDGSNESILYYPVQYGFTYTASV